MCEGMGNSAEWSAAGNRGKELIPGLREGRARGPFSDGKIGLGKAREAETSLFRGLTWSPRAGRIKRVRKRGGRIGQVGLVFRF